MKYMGSKARFAKEILNVISSYVETKDKTLVEPFAGGMNFTSAAKVYFKSRIANDVNPYLIAMWKALQEGWVPPESISKEFYLQCKVGDCKDHERGYVGFNCSYSGKWFGGYAGVTQTKSGVRDYQKEAFKNVTEQLIDMQDVYLSCKPYSEIDIPINSVVYCDPPYFGTTKYKDDFDHNAFWTWVRDISKSHLVFVSEYTAPEDFKCIWEKSAKSSLSANGKSGGNKESVERLFILNS